MDTKDPSERKRRHGLDPSGPMGSPMPPSGHQGPQKDPGIGSQGSYGVICAPQWTPRTPKGDMGWIPVVLWAHLCPPSGSQGPRKDPWVGSQWSYGVTHGPQWTPRTPKGPMGWIPVVLWGHLCPPMDTKDPKRTHGLDPSGPMGSSMPCKDSKRTHGVICALQDDPKGHKDPKRTPRMDPGGPPRSSVTPNHPMDPKRTHR